jgi:hypothetical protein
MFPRGPGSGPSPKARLFYLFIYTSAGQSIGHTAPRHTQRKQLLLSFRSAGRSAHQEREALSRAETMEGPAAAEAENGGAGKGSGSRFRRVCVFCGSSSGKRSSYRDAAVELGKELVSEHSMHTSVRLGSSTRRSSVE